MESTDLHWYVGCVRSCQEKNVAASLQKMAVGCYLPVRREVHKWSDRKKVVETLVIPRYVFIHCSESRRMQVLKAEPRIWAFLSLEGRPSVVRDTEMEAFMKMVENGRSLKLHSAGALPGDRVRVVEGPLAGIECELVRIDGNRCLAVSLGALGTATMELDIDSVERI